jgi:hypothetical protein
MKFNNPIGRSDFIKTVEKTTLATGFLGSAMKPIFNCTL